METIYKKGVKHVTLHFGDSVKEYHETDCIGKLIEVTTNQSNNTSEKLLGFEEIPKEVLRKIIWPNYNVD